MKKVIPPMLGGASSLQQSHLPYQYAIKRGPTQAPPVIKLNPIEKIKEVVDEEENGTSTNVNAPLGFKKAPPIVRGRQSPKLDTTNEGIFTHDLDGNPIRNTQTPFNAKLYSNKLNEFQSQNDVLFRTIQNTKDGERRIQTSPQKVGHFDTGIIVPYPEYIHKPPELHSFGRLNEQIKQITAITSGDCDLRTSLGENSKLGVVN